MKKIGAPGSLGALGLAALVSACSKGGSPGTQASSPALPPAVSVPSNDVTDISKFDPSTSEPSGPAPTFVPPTTMPEPPATVSGPAARDTPTGATAECVDGTLYYSQRRQGACSRHGGVARWL